jgi:tetratricopeptide (TPR) repeat protein
MRPLRLAMLVLAAGLGGCATLGDDNAIARMRANAETTAVHALLRDERFPGAAAVAVDTDTIFGLNDAMRRYVDQDIAPLLRSKGLQRGLVEALYKRDLLKLDYDASRTRNAAEAFEARAGNCLSLVILTGALARELGLRVHYQSAYTDETWARSGQFVFRSGHVNITLGRRWLDAGTARLTHEYTIDFLPAGKIGQMRTREISERTVIAMFLNNRAAEALAQSRIDEAYAWARAAALHDAGFMSAVNTLGVVLAQRGEIGAAEAAFRHVLVREADNARALGNLVDLLGRSGREAEAAPLRLRLAQIEPDPPFHFFDLGRAAMERGDHARARDLFEREIDRMPYHPEFHFWAAQASWRLGETEAAGRHLRAARDHSTNVRDRDLYAAKLAWLRDGRRLN